MKKVSIILPVYNAIKYIEATLQSLVNQTFSDFELILIDDGATDGSAKICDEYAAKDERIRVIHQENAGICAARNAGLAAAKGEWIAFCDHDDIYELNYLERALGRVTRADADVVKFEYHAIGINADGKVFMDETWKLKDAVYTPADLASEYTHFNICIRAVWNGLYKRSVITAHKIEFDPSYKMGMEDYDFNIRFMRFAKKMATMHECLYTHYNRKNQSTSSKFNENKLNDIARCAKLEKKLLNEMDCEMPFETMAMHNAIYLSLYTELLMVKGTTLAKSEQKRYLQELRSSGGMFDFGLRGIKAAYDVNWKFGIKLHMFSWKMYGLLLAYQRANDKRKGR